MNIEREKKKRYWVKLCAIVLGLMIILFVIFYWISTIETIIAVAFGLYFLQNRRQKEFIPLYDKEIWNRKYFGKPVDSMTKLK